MGQNYGTRFVKFTNHHKTILVATRVDEQHLVVYWSLHDNVILASFSGYKKRVTYIESNPLNSTFLSMDENYDCRVFDYDKVEPIVCFNECNCA